MEFVGNQINIKTISATLTVAFFVGRIELFGGTFPAAAALITVMAAVSTVYIYLVPVMALAMATCSGGTDFYGDMFAMIFCGIFFLFFHRQKFTINQRTAVAAAAVILFNCLYYAADHILYLLSIQTLIQEALAVIVYIRVFNTLARIIFVGKEKCGAVSGEKAGLAFEIAGISLIGAIGFSPVVFPFWVLAVLIIAYCKGIQPALSAAVIAAVYAQCSHMGNSDLFFSLFTALVIGWFLAALIDSKYRKTALAVSMFAVMAVAAGNQIYGAAAAAAIFIAIPSEMLIRLWCSAEEQLMPETASDTDLRIAAIKRDLMQKKRAFSSLAKLYGQDMGSRQIISHQFNGMARTVDEIIRDLNGNGDMVRERERSTIPVGSASYAYENISGDSCLSFSFGRNKQAMIISDGMGKGSRAAAESKLVVTTMAELLQAGFDVDIAMKTINAILMTGRKSDMFATVDLAIINKETGRAQIFKMGAASTFVKHDGKVSMLKRPAPPVGIVDGLKLEYIDVRLRRGDLLMMVSDGITDCDRKDPDCFWLRERLTTMGSKDPDTVAELIINKAAEKYGIKERDDLTVMVAAV